MSLTPSKDSHRARHVKYLKARGIAKIISLPRRREEEAAGRIGDLSPAKVAKSRRPVSAIRYSITSLETTDSRTTEFRVFADTSRTGAERPDVVVV